MLPTFFYDSHQSRLAIHEVGPRLRLEAAGFCTGRGTGELVFALHAAIEHALVAKLDIFVMYVDLSKCFMSFDRRCGLWAQAWYGLPASACDALRGLYHKVTGRFETAFGSTDIFAILRGFIQAPPE